MALFYRSHLLSGILAGVLTTAISAVAVAQPDEDEKDADDASSEPTEVDLDDDDDDDDEPPPPPPDDSGDSSESTWGVGGEEPEGKYKPQGRTGKLAELEEEDEEEREVAEGPPDLDPPGFAYLDTVIGFGSVLAPAHEQGATSISPTASFLIGIGYRIGDTWNVYANFPISTGENDGPLDPFVDGARNPDIFTQIAVGNFEVGVEPHFILNRDMKLPVGLGIAFPSAQGDMFADVDNQADVGRRIVNQGAAASRGWEDRHLFSSKHMSLVPMVGLHWKIRDLGPMDLRLEPEMEAAVMIRTGGTEPDVNRQPPGALRDVSVTWVLQLDAWADFFDKLLQFSPRLRLVIATAEEGAGASCPDDCGIDPGGAAFVFEPTIGSHLDFTDDDSFGMDFRLGYVLPLGGELNTSGAADLGIGGLRMRAGFFF
jgi:hypothetical protein